jgi:hypothetical protein
MAGPVSDLVRGGESSEPTSVIGRVRPSHDIRPGASVRPIASP